MNTFNDEDPAEVYDTYELMRNLTPNSGEYIEALAIYDHLLAFLREAKEPVTRKAIERSIPSLFAVRCATEPRDTHEDRWSDLIDCDEISWIDVKRAHRGSYFEREMKKLERLGYVRSSKREGQRALLWRITDKYRPIDMSAFEQVLAS